MKTKIENIPLFSYFGNKDNEMEEIYNNIPNMDNIDIIIEPYCGSFALTRYLLLKYPNKKYICNDNDKFLIETYKTLQDDNKFNELLEFYKTFEINDKEHYNEFKKENTIRSYLFIRIIYRMHYGLYDKNKHRFNDRDFNRLIHFNKTYKNIEFICDDAINIINKYKDNEKVFMFLDPPFLLTASFYNTCMASLLQHFFDLLMNINNIKSKLLGVCGDHFLLIPFYEKYNINIKFKTSINYRGCTKNKHDNIYVSNY